MSLTKFTTDARRQLSAVDMMAEKYDAITELIDVLDRSGQLQNRQVALEAVFTREKTRSTGIGSGIAIPHGKCRAVKQLVMAMGIAREPIEFDSVDNIGVSIVILLISPLEQTGPHIQALAKISKLMLDAAFRNALQQAASAEAAYKLLSERESE